MQINYTSFTTGASQDINTMSITSKIVFVILLLITLIFIVLRIKLEKDKQFVATYFGAEATKNMMLKSKKTKKQEKQPVIQKEDSFPNIDPNKQLLRRLENGIYCYYQQAEDGSYFRVKTPENN